MKLARLGVVTAGAFAMVGLVIACSSSSNGSGTSSGSSSSSSGASSSGASSSGASSSGASSSSSGASSSGASSSGASSSGSSGNPGDKCTPAAGTYKTHYTVGADSGATCQAPPDGTIDLGQTDGGTGDASTPGCTVNTDTSTCTTTLDCTTDQSGYTSKVHTEEKYDNGTLTGTQHTTLTKDSDGSVLSDCTLEFTYTKQ